MSLTPQMNRYETCLMCGGPVPAGMPCQACISGEPLDGASLPIFAPADIAQRIAETVKAERAWWIKAIEAYFDATAVMDIETHVAKARALAAQEGGE